ncbi:MAG: hypothetical protein DLD55_05750 [candidate division SR1 bacterium]|nr:MAG: hypothetical protein DLD55_05750 [candidate division SR1 bacterium]
MIKLIIFDLRKTLAYRDVEKSSTTQMLEQTGSSLPKKDFVKIFENSVQTKKRTNKYEAYENLCKNMGLPMTKDNVNLLMNIRDYAESQSKLYLYTIPMLKQLRKLGYKIGLLSNSSIFAVEVLKRKTNLLDYIDYPLFSFEVGTIKPDLAFFEKMLEITGYKPEEVIMVGDKLHDDVLPPRELGMNAILFENYEQLKSDFASFGIVLA